MRQLPILAEIDGLKVQDRAVAAGAAQERVDAGGTVAGGRRCGEEIGYQSGSACAGARLRGAQAAGVVEEEGRAARQGAWGGVGPGGTVHRATRVSHARSAAVNRDGMVVELVATDGTRLTIRTQQASAAVVEMISAFRGRA